MAIFALLPGVKINIDRSFSQNLETRFILYFLHLENYVCHLDPINFMPLYAYLHEYFSLFC